MSGYSDGVRVEHAVIHDLQLNGYRTIRAASSKGFCDVVATKPGQALFVNVKRTRMPPPAERADLLRVSGFLPDALPIVALKPLGCPLQYRLLTGPGAAQWVPWTPDELGGAA